MPHTKVHIGDDNEIQVKCSSVMKEYYKKSEATIKAFTDDGFSRTGDTGYLTDNMDIIITERIKTLYLRHQTGNTLHLNSCKHY